MGNLPPTETDCLCNYVSIIIRLLCLLKRTKTLLLPHYCCQLLSYCYSLLLPFHSFKHPTHKSQLCTYYLYCYTKTLMILLSSIKRYNLIYVQLCLPELHNGNFCRELNPQKSTCGNFYISMVISSN